MVEPVAEMSGTMLQVVNGGRLVSTGGKISNVRINQRPQRAGIESPALRCHCKRRSKHENSPSRILPAGIMRSERPPVLAAVGRWTLPTPHNNVLRILYDHKVRIHGSYAPPRH